MKSLATDTLAYQLGVRPALQSRDMSSVPLKKVVEQLNEFMELDNIYDWIGHGAEHNEKIMGSPQKDALTFYMLKHAVLLLRKQYHPLEPLPPKVMKLLERYNEEVVARGTRMFYYLLQICVRESRHSSGVSSVTEKQLRAKYTDKVVDFHGTIEPLGESMAVSKFRKEAPDVPVGLWVGFMSEHFREYHYGGAFGGEPWGRIADVARDFVKGDISLDLLLDTSFTLAHNTSPAFDKGMLFSHYDSDLLKILDVQNSGQTPALVNEKGVKVAQEMDIQVLFKLAKDAVGDPLLPKPYVDWYKVEEDGEGLNTDKKGGHKANYPAEKKAQALKYGIPNEAPAKQFVQGVQMKHQQAKKEAEELATVVIFAGKTPGGKAQTIKKVARKDIE
jgi:hypothetical protein